MNAEAERVLLALRSTLVWKGEGTNGRGNFIYRFFNGDSDRCRYTFDTGLGPHWEQFDTSADAWYYGVWVSKEALSVLHYAEGDVSLVVCPTSEKYNEEINDLCDFHEEGFIAKAVDRGGTVTTFVQDRSKFLVEA